MLYIDNFYYLNKDKANKKILKLTLPAFVGYKLVEARVVSLILPHPALQKKAVLTSPLERGKLETSTQGSENF
ncbi:hypothetical protein GCM10022397_17530 [Flavivirga jejuensis]